MSQSPGRTTWLLELLSDVVVASGIGYLAACFAVSRWLTKAKPGRPRQTPSDYGLSWEPLTCLTADGLRLTGWVVTPRFPRATAALFHGLGGSREQTLSRIAFLTAAGYRCVAFDHRAHGESDGRQTSFGYFEGRDVTAVLDLIRQRWPYQPRVALGISMGAAALCFAAEKVRGFDALILESLYHDIGSAFSNRINSSYPPWCRRFRTGIIWMTERRLGLRVDQIAPAELIGLLAPAPVLLLTGTEDDHAPPAEAERLFHRCQGPRELWLVPGAAHRDVFETGGLAYQQRILEFLDRWLPVAVAA